MLCPDCKQPMIKSTDKDNHCVDVNCPPSRTQCPKCESSNTYIKSKSITDADMECKDCSENWTISRS